MAADVLRPDWLTTPLADRFANGHPGFAAAMEAHARAVEAGEAGYLDPSTGLFVMTAAYLCDRGWCCGQGCRHCPYVPKEGDEARSEPGAGSS